MIEEIILGGLLYNEEYMRKVIPFLKDEYFDNKEQKNLFVTITEFIKKYNTLPTKNEIEYVIDSSTSLNTEEEKELLNLYHNIQYDEKTNEDWLLDKTEKFCQDKALYNAIRQSILVLDDNQNKLDKGSIPKILQDALGISFDTNVGHDFIENYEDRYDFYHRKEERIPFDIDIFNDITKGGLPKKSLNIIMSGTGVGKTLAMCHFAASHLMFGKNILYITLEMAEERIAERIDANLIDMSIDDIHKMPKDVFEKKINRLKSKSPGKLIIKEYPTASAGSANFRYLMNELKIKKNFQPDIIFIDYLNICISSRLKNSNNINSYTYIKAIAEELRGLAVEFEIPIVSATQVNRSGFTSSDIGLEDVSESFGLPATADFMFALISTEELESLNQIMVKQLKNRWGDPNYYKRFVIGIDRSRMRLYNTEQSAQDDIIDDRPVMDKSAFGERWDEQEKDSYMPKKFNKKTIFSGFA